VSLTVYDKKRDFTRTPEPRRARAVKKKNESAFVVQRHNATRLHYDFRLEMAGVLKSWAIPRGPSMVPGEKRLAVMVEDHPLEYGRFYGSIPEGNYGAGIVEIWDKGTYRPSVNTADPEKTLLEMLDKGDIKLNLNGTYLKGKFALFLLKNQEKENEWMLVKKADEYADDDFNIESLPPLKSKKMITGKTGKRKHHDSFPDPLPAPMLAKQAGKIPGNSSWIYEIKLDGYRIICPVRDKRVELVSRNGKRYDKQFSVLLEDLGKISENLILDGEVVAEDPKGRSNFQLLQNYDSTGKGDLKYYVFDILYLNGFNIMNIPLILRRELLDALFEKYEFKRVIKLEYQTGNGTELFQKTIRKGYEGVMAKDPDSIYMPGKRSDSWLKIKSTLRQEAVICGYTMPRGSRKYFGSIILGVNEDEKMKYAGCCGTGFSDITLKELYKVFSGLETEICPFGEPPDLSWLKGEPVWIKPQYVASIKFMEWSGGDIMRMPVFMGLREDADPAEIVNEMKAGHEERKGAGDVKAKEKTVVLSGKKLKLTNLTKVYWPDEGYTKGDLISYYQKISRYILPYLKDRPQSLNRHPGGITKKGFYHKDMNTDLIPKWIRTVNMESESHSEGINYLICNNIATLLYMVNLGCIEINPWHSTYKQPDSPDYLVLDLDPGDVPFSNVIDTALVIKELCDEIEALCYPKTSGATGLHVYIPLRSGYNYDQARTFAEIIATIVNSRLPSVTSIERPVSKRRDKVYIDFLQNRKGQTIAAPYSVRPVPFATISAPLEWNEVNFSLAPSMFTIYNMVHWLEKRGDLWQPLLKKGISLDKALKAIEKLGK